MCKENELAQSEKGLIFSFLEGNINIDRLSKLQSNTKL